MVFERAWVFAKLFPKSFFGTGIEPMTWGELLNRYEYLQSPALPTELPKVGEPLLLFYIQIYIFKLFTKSLAKRAVYKKLGKKSCLVKAWQKELFSKKLGKNPKAVGSDRTSCRAAITIFCQAFFKKLSPYSGSTTHEHERFFLLL